MPEFRYTIEVVVTATSQEQADLTLEPGLELLDDCFAKWSAALERGAWPTSIRRENP